MRRRAALRVVDGSSRPAEPEGPAVLGVGATEGDTVTLPGLGPVTLASTAYLARDDGATVALLFVRDAEGQDYVVGLELERTDGQEARASLLWVVDGNSADGSPGPPEAA